MAFKKFNCKTPQQININEKSLHMENYWKVRRATEKVVYYHLNITEKNNKRR